MGDKPPIQLLVRPQFDDASYYEVCWVNEVPAWAGSGGRLVSEIPEDCLDLAPFMAARALLKSAYDLTRLSIVRLYGADYEMLRAPLGAAAATPLVNFAAPVTGPASCVIYLDLSS